LSTKTLDKFLTQYYILYMENTAENGISSNSPSSSLSSAVSATPAGAASKKAPNPYKKIYITLMIIFAVLAVVIGSFAYLLRKNNGSNMLSPFSLKQGASKIAEANKVVNPLTGELFSKDEVPWEDTRPLAVMVNNHADARPHSGLIYADLVYEIVAEGGITRFLAFYLSNTPEKIGPVRSTREYYLVLVKEQADAMLMHIGYSPQALEAIQTWPVRSLARGGADFWREERGVATEHTAYVNGKDLRVLGDQLGWQGTREVTPLKFKDGEKYTTAEDSTEIIIDFWYEGDYSAIFKYQPDTNSYLRFTGYDLEGNPIAHKDQETQKQVEVKNLIVQFVAESPILGDDKNRLEYQLIGSGEGVAFIDGKAIPVTWSKDSRDERTLFYDTNGSDMEFNRGKFWISIVPDRNSHQVVY
jgi:hypothetical protein